MNDITSLKVVACPYYPMQPGNGIVNKVTGIFVVVYSEFDDNSVIIPQNVLALKVTTSRPYTSMFVAVNDSTSLTLDGKKAEFAFRKESFILGSHLNTLPACNCTVLGELSLEDSSKVLSMLSNCFNKTTEQACRVLINKA